jgi:hypothetical protein
LDAKCVEHSLDFLVGSLLVPISATVIGWSGLLPWTAAFRTWPQDYRLDQASGGNFFPIGYVPVKMVWRSLKRKVPGVAVILVITLSRHPSIKQAEEQLKNCRVSVLDKNERIWVERKVKGWAVLNQWSFQLSNVGPYLYVVDPDTEGETLPLDDLPPLIRYVARGHVGSLFRGLRLYSLANSISYMSDEPSKEAIRYLSEASPVIVTVAALGGVTAIGRFFRLGPGDVGTSAFGEEIFIGVQNEVIEDLQGSSEAAPVVLGHPSQQVNRIALGRAVMI